MSSLHPIKVSAPQVPLYIATCVLVKAKPKFVETSTAVDGATKENQTVLLKLFGAQQGGVAGSPTLVAPTFVYAIEVQVPLVTGIDIAPEQASFAG